MANARKYFVLLLFLSVWACRKKSSPCNSFVRPTHPLFFEIKKDGQFVTDNSILSTIKLSFYQNNTKKYISDLTVSDTIIAGSVVNKLLSTVNIASTSADNGIEVYYVEYPAALGATDTLYVNYSPPTPDNNCTYLFNQVMINKQTPPINASIKLPDPKVSVYIFNK